LPDRELQREQDYVSRLYQRLDGMRDQFSRRLRAAAHSAGSSRQAQVERDAAHARYQQRLAQLSAAEDGLCFGRLDLLDGTRRYIGRIRIAGDGQADGGQADGGQADGGLAGGGHAEAGPAGDREPLLIDWRAPAARPFYVATPLSPEGVRRRRYLRERHRKVLEINDELLDPGAAAGGQGDGITGEAALLAAVNASRTGRMTDIVQTIQADQDRIIRAGRDGVLVVQGGPGTGKTAVALHRAAYLLYTWREQLARRVVLVVGPNTTFLRYIENVLPSLGETSVLLATVSQLYPGVTADRAESRQAAEIKGRLLMAEVVAAAVADRQWLPEDALEVSYEHQLLRLPRAVCARVREAARGCGLPHNQARPLVVREISAALARGYARQIGTDPYDGQQLLGEAEIAEIRRDMLTDPAVCGALDQLWPELTPQQLLAGLFSSADRLAAAAPQLRPAERDQLRRDPDGGFAPSDVPLLDEAAELLGTDDRVQRARLERARRQRIAYAQGVLDVAAGSAPTDLEIGQEPEILQVKDVIDAVRLAGRQEEDYRTPAQRAAADRAWAFGHVIVDEAQELSEMAWRVLMRRCPSKSMTVVGDLAQASEPGGASSWQRMLGRYTGDRWRLAELTVNYRVPAEIMAVAAGVLAGLSPSQQAPRSVRATGVSPWHLAVPRTQLAVRLGELAAREAAVLGGRRLAVIVPAGSLRELSEAVAAAVPAATIGRDPGLASAVTVLDVRQAKGLEFDSVLVAEPARILAASPRGHSDLYVALTRATQRLGVLHSEPLPAVLAGLRPLGDQPDGRLIST
jgi:DNA helicase IV